MAKQKAINSSSQPEVLEDWLDDHVDEYVHILEDKFQLWFRRGLIAFAIMALSSVAALVAFGFLLEDAHDKSNRIESIAKDANKKAQNANIKIAFNKEKVCSQTSNKIVACRALFQRLSDSISEDQRLYLACSVMQSLHGSTVDIVLRDNPKCQVIRPDK